MMKNITQRCWRFSQWINLTLLAVVGFAPLQQSQAQTTADIIPYQLIDDEDCAQTCLDDELAGSGTWTTNYTGGDMNDPANYVLDNNNPFGDGNPEFPGNGDPTTGICGVKFNAEIDNENGRGYFICVPGLHPDHAGPDGMVGTDDDIVLTWANKSGPNNGYVYILPGPGGPDACGYECGEECTLTCDIEGPTTICQYAQDLVYTAIIPDGYTIVSYHWTVTGDATITSPNGQSSITINAGSSSFNVSLEVTDDNGCTST